MADSQEFRSRFYRGNIVFLIILGFIVIALYLLSDVLSAGKLDLTADHVYSISDSTKGILSKLKDQVKVTYYVSEDVVLQTLRRDTQDTFKEFADISNGRFKYVLVNPESEADRYAEEKVQKYEADKRDNKTPEEPEPVKDVMSIFMQKKQPTKEERRAEREKQAAAVAKRQDRKNDEVYKEILQEEWKGEFLDKIEQEGIHPVSYRDVQASSIRQVKVYSAVKLEYIGKEPEIIPFHDRLEGLEYEVASRILKLTNPEKPMVAFFDGRKSPAPPMNPMNPVPPPEGDYEQVIQYLSRDLFDVRSVGLREGDSLDDLVKRMRDDQRRKAEEEEGTESKKEEDQGPPTNEDLKRFLKCLIVAQPDQLEPRQVYEINRAVSLGIPAIFLVSRYSLDISPQGRKQQFPIAQIRPGIEDLLKKWGIEIRQEVLASNRAGTIIIPRPVMGNMVMNSPVQVSACVASTGESISQTSSLTNKIGVLIFPATTGLKLASETLEKNKLTHEVLAKTVDETWSVKVDPYERLQHPFEKHKGVGISLLQYQEDLVQMKDDKFRDFIEPTPLAVLVHGKLPFTFEGENVPEWKKEEKQDDGRDPHAGIPGFPDADHDLALNPVDPQDAAAPPPAAQGTAPAAAAETPPTVAPAPATAPTGAAPAPVTPPAESPGVAPPAGAAQATTAPAPAPTPATTPAPAPAAEPAKAPVKASVEAAEGTIVVLASADMFKTEYLAQEGGAYQTNLLFFQNAIENLTLGNDLINIRRKELTNRQFKPGSEKYTWWIKTLNVAAIPALVGILGLVYYFSRRAESVAYERRFVERP